MKALYLPVSRWPATLVNLELLRRFHWRRWFETRNRKHYIFAKAVEAHMAEIRERSAQ